MSSCFIGRPFTYHFENDWVLNEFSLLNLTVGSTFCCTFHLFLDLFFSRSLWSLLLSLVCFVVFSCCAVLYPMVTLFTKFLSKTSQFFCSWTSVMSARTICLQDYDVLLQSASLILFFLSNWSSLVCYRIWKLVEPRSSVIVRTNKSLKIYKPWWCVWSFWNSMIIFVNQGISFESFFYISCYQCNIMFFIVDVFKMTISYHM